jgi:hypothetical protein
MKFIFAVAVSCTLAGTAFAATAPAPMKKLSVVTNPAGFEVAHGRSRDNVPSPRGTSAPGRSVSFPS